MSRGVYSSDSITQRLDECIAAAALAFDDNMNSHPEFHLLEKQVDRYRSRLDYVRVLGSCVDRHEYHLYEMFTYLLIRVMRVGLKPSDSR